MPALILALIVASTTFAYLHQRGWLPGVAVYTPELLSAGLLLCVVALGVRDRFRLIKSTYLILFGTLVLIMLCGIIANTVEVGPIFAGLRNYLRAIPLFFVPAVFAFTPRQNKQQLQLLLLLCLVQLPLAVQQRRHTAFTGGFTGDQTYGTLMDSGVMSIFLIGAACVLTSFYLRKRISLFYYLPLVLLILIPTTINETKATLILLPIGLLFTFILGSPRQTRVRNTIIAAAFITVLLSGFVAIYDTVQAGRPYRTTLTEFFLKGRAERYLQTGKQSLGYGEKEVGRVDSMMVALHYISEDPVHYAFGLGIGNASRSSLGPRFQGAYSRLFEPFMKVMAVRLMLEIGILGLALVLALMYMIYRDARVVGEKDPGIVGGIAVAWCGIAVIMTICIFYRDLLRVDSLSYLFWYFSGLIAAQRMRLAADSE